MEWSKYSEAIFDHYTSSSANLIVQACPGAGKTTNIKHLWTLDDRPTVYLVFNKQNQLEAEAKLPAKDGSAVLTLNGLGHRALINTFGSVELDTKKVLNIIKRLISPKWKRQRMDFKEIREREWMLNSAVHHAKFLCMDDCISTPLLEEMLSTYDLESYPEMEHDINTVLAENDDMQTVIDFDDQIRLPALYQCQLPEYDNVLGDEVQDFNAMQALLVSRLNAKRYVFVGDKRQSIYGFRGAMNDSMQYLKERFNCTELPLSITYRCAKRIVTEAHAVWPDIEAWDESPDGTVSMAKASDEAIIAALKQCTQPEHGIVLCRMNRPLVSLAYELLQQGIACHVRGRDIAQGLIALMKKFPVGTVRELIQCVKDYEAIEVAKAHAADDASKAVSVQDKVGSLTCFAGKIRLDDSPERLVEEINRVFEQGKGVVLSTVHKAKGLEAERCYLLEHGLYDFCAQRSRHAWQVEQEKNVKYVALTRGKHELVYM